MHLRPSKNQIARRSWAFMLAIVLALAGTAHAEGVPAELEIAIHMNVLSFDRALKDRVRGDTLTVAVLHADTVNTAELLRAFAVFAKKRTVHGKQIRAVTIPITNDIATKIPDQVAALYVTAGASNLQLAAVAGVAQSRSLPTLCGIRAYLSSGIAVAVVPKDNKPSIVIHAANAKRSGMAFDTRFLRLTEVVR